MNRVKKLIKNPYIVFSELANHRLLNFLSDESYIKLVYRARMGEKINLENPKTFNEKINWLKIHNRKQEYIKMVDKCEAKKYAENIIGEEYIIPTLGVYEKFEDIDFEKLPNQFVIKCTHDSGGVFIVKNKSEMNIKEARKKINNSLKHNYYYAMREWPYKDVKPRIIIEKYMESSKEEGIKDYKIFCFNGEPKFTLVCSNRNGRNKNTDFYDLEWNLLPFTRARHNNSKNGIEKPNKYDEMIKIARNLSKDIPFVRVDLYEINNQIFFGELTFFPSGGFEGFSPKEWDEKLGNWIEL